MDEKVKNPTGCIDETTPLLPIKRYSQSWNLLIICVCLLFILWTLWVLDDKDCLKSCLSSGICTEQYCDRVLGILFVFEFGAFICYFMSYCLSLDVLERGNNIKKKSQIKKISLVILLVLLVLWFALISSFWNTMTFEHIFMSIDIVLYCLLLLCVSIAECFL